MIRRNVLCAALLAAGLGCAAQAAEVKVINLDEGTGKGLEDPTPAAPLGGNPGTTRGQQAYRVFKFAADIWGAILKSEVPILDTITFQPLACTANSATLGSAGTTSIFYFNPGADLPKGAKPNLWYHSALADALAGADNADEPGDPDIASRFNGEIGKPGCLEGSGWYFGLDGRTPASQTNFLNVVLHEMGHGLGFSGFNSLSAGTQFDGVPDIYSSFVKDNATGKAWTAMTDAERKAAALDDNHLVFTGPNVKAEAPLALGPPTVLRIAAPAAAAGDYEFAQASFGPVADADNFRGAVVQAQSAGLTDGCAPLDNAAAIAGRIALIDRGSCDFTVKALNAQAAGASGVLLANNQAGAVTPGGTPAQAVTIPVILVSQTDAAKLKASLDGLAANGIGNGQGLAGADAAGNVKLYAPSVLAQGSSFSHYDTRLSPNALMEYAITPTLAGQIDVDLTPALFKDEGWQLNQGGQRLLGCDTGVPTWLPGGVIVGANIYASARLLAGTRANFADYRRDIRGYARDLADQGLVDRRQRGSLAACLGDAWLQQQYRAWANDGAGAAAAELAIGLRNGEPVRDQSAPAGAAELLYRIEVPAGAKALVIRSHGKHAALYVKRDAEPSAASYDYASRLPGAAQVVVVPKPKAGAYLIKLIGSRGGFEGIGLEASFVPPWPWQLAEAH